MRTLLLLVLAALAAGCARSRTIEVTTTPAPVREADVATHFRIVDVDEETYAVILEPVAIDVVDVNGEVTEILRVSGSDRIAMPFETFASLVDEEGVDTVDLEAGDILEATYGPGGKMTGLTPRRDLSDAPPAR